MEIIVAWDSFAVSETLPAEAEPDEFQTLFVKNLERLGSVRVNAIGGAIKDIRFRPRGQIVRAIVRSEISKNKRNNHVVSVVGKTSISIIIWLAILVLVFITNGIALPICIVLILVTRKKPRECVEDAVASTVRQF